MGRIRILRPLLAVSMIVASGLVGGQLHDASANDVVPFTQELRIPPVYTAPNIDVTMRKACVPVLPGRCTDMWTYDGMFPGPTIRRPSGQLTRVTFKNDLPPSVGSTSVHHHGSHSEAEYDGQPDDHLIGPGEKYTYNYDFMEDGAPERAAFQWYHDHRMDVTGRNVWMGLAGMFVLDDDFDSALPLPKGKYDVPLMVVDRSFDKDNQLDYKFSSTGVTGDHILVNGVPSPYFDVADRSYRFRILNASNFREYRFEFANGQEMTQVASESGLLPKPVVRKSITLGPAERAEVIVNFAGHLGENLVLANTIDPVTNDMTPVPRQVMQFRVVRHAGDNTRIPDVLRPLPPLTDKPEVTRVFTLGAIPGAGKTRHPDDANPLQFLWTINGKAYEHDHIAVKPKLGSTERWVFVNPTVGLHRIHIHDVDWRVVSRSKGVPILTPGDQDVALGEGGLKETFLVQSGETVVVETKFTDHVGTYVFHCHILEHEDNGMMAQFQVVGPDGARGSDPAAHAPSAPGAVVSHHAPLFVRSARRAQARTKDNTPAPTAEHHTTVALHENASDAGHEHPLAASERGAQRAAGMAVLGVGVVAGILTLQKNRPGFARIASAALALQLGGLGWDMVEHAAAGERLDLFENAGHFIAMAGFIVLAVAVALPSLPARFSRTRRAA